MKKMFKKIIAIAVVAIVATTLIVPTTAVQAKTKAYYSGDAITYKDQVIVASTNMGGLEIFKLEAGKLVRKNYFRSFDAIYSAKDDYYDVALSEESGNLYAYLVDGVYMYKYDISSLTGAKIVERVHDNAWDWLLGVEKVNGQIITIGTKSVKIWNKDLQVVDSYKVFNKHQYSINFDQSGRYIYNADEGTLKIFDRLNRVELSSLKITNKESHGRKITNFGNDIYVLDDMGVRVINPEGKTIRSTVHSAKMGYDIAGLSASKYVYLTIGNQVVKMQKSDLKMVLWQDTTNMTATGGWAMGMKVVKDSKGEKVVIFNNSNISVVDENLKYIAGSKASAEAVRPWEPITIKLDKTRAAVNSDVLVSGSGFGYNEKVVVTIAGSQFNAIANDQGKFSVIIKVPSVNASAKRTDIKAVGQDSKISYSVSFQID